MELISRFADAWMPVFLAHMLEVSAFILLVCGVDRLLRPGTRLRCALYLIALAKVFVPPVVSLPAPLPGALPAQAVLQPVIASLGAVEKAGGSRLSLLLFGAWAGSVLLLTGIVIRQNVAVRRCLRLASPVPGSKFKVQSSKFQTLNLEPSNLEPFRVFSCPAISTPTLVGFRRPRLYLPEGWEAWPEGHLRSVLAHEMAHHRARDLYALALQTLAVILFGLNPLVWMLHARLIHLRELRCDEAAIHQTGIRPVDYSRVLFAFVDRQGGPPLPGLTGMSFSESSCTISGRFNHVLNLPPDRGREAPWHYAAPVLLGLAILPFSFRWDGPLPDALREGPVTEVLGRVLPPEDIARSPAPPARAEGLSPGQAVPPQPARARKARPEPEKLPAPEEFVPVEVAPVAVDLPTPVYPEAARLNGVEGVVFIQLLVSATGAVKDVRVMKGPEIFHEAAREAARQSVWRPALQNNKHVPVWVAYPVRFVLK